MGNPKTIPCPKWGCKGTMGRRGTPHDQTQQYVCRKCGRVKNKRVHCWFNSHRWSSRIKGRKRAPKDIRCKKCGIRKPLIGGTK